MCFSRAHLVLLASLFALTSGCRTPSGHTDLGDKDSPRPQKATEPIRLTVVATNDLHGWVHPVVTRHKSGVMIEQGGLVNFASYLRQVRATNPEGVLLIDAGDLFQGTLAANLTEGAVVVEAFNHLGYTAAAMGNHEFDYGPVGPLPVATEPGQDPFGAIKVRLAQARFPLLAANVYEAASGERPNWLPNDGTHLVEVKGVKVGIVGLITPTTPQVTNPVNVSSLRFGSLVPEAAAAARRLRERGATVLIAAVHAGGKCASYADPEDLSSCDLKNGEIFQMVEELPRGTFDLVLVGHDHVVLAHRVNGTWVSETAGFGSAFALIDLQVDPKTRQAIPERTTLRPQIPICAMVDAQTQSCDARELKNKDKVELVQATYEGQPVVPDAALAKLIAPALALVEAEQRRKLALSVPAELWRDYEGESALGTFLADSLREMERTDVALLNSGGLRAELPAGELTYGDVFAVIPFDNTVATVTVTGEELKRLLHAAYGARKGVFQVSGIKVRLSRCPGPARLKSFTLANGKPIQPEKLYRVSMPDFLARGGDGLAAVLGSLPPGRIEMGGERPLNFRDALVAFWQKKKVPLVAAKLGRVTFVDEGPGCTPGATVNRH
jgi:5'-nucleotidase